MYGMAFFKIWPEPDSTRYQTNLILVAQQIFWFSVWYECEVLFPVFVVSSFVCLHTA